jgi:hypothetical protein
MSETMKEIVILRSKLLPVFLGLFLPLQLFGVNPADEEIRAELNRGIELTINNRFSEALHIYDELIQRFPHHPMGYFYKGATLQAYMLDAENYQQKSEFFRLMEQTIRCADSLKRNDNETAWTLFFEGSAYLYRSFMKSRLGKWFSAYRDAVHGVGWLGSALERDSLLYDAYLGIGSFKYWKSARANFLLWLPFIKDERQAGIEMIQKSIRKGMFSRWIARDQLSWILLDKGDCDEALAIANEDAKTFPQSRFFKWTQAEAAYKCGNYDLSRRIFEKLLIMIRDIPQRNYYNEIYCLTKLAAIEYQQKNWDSAYRFADLALRLNISKQIRDRAKKKLELALEIRTKAGDHLNLN